MRELSSRGHSPTLTFDVCRAVNLSERERGQAERFLPREWANCGRGFGSGGRGGTAYRPGVGIQILGTRRSPFISADRYEVGYDLEASTASDVVDL